MHALLLAAGVLTSVVQFQSLDHGQSLEARLYVPAVRPAPAVVVLHPCGGIDQSVLDWAAWLAENGYIAFAPDSLGLRNEKSVCTSHDVTPQMRALDAYGALSYLRTRPDVDFSHIGVVGFSEGADAVLSTEAQLSAHPAFEAAVAFGPSASCAQPTGSPAFPLLVLSGSESDARTRVLSFLRQYL